MSRPLARAIAAQLRRPSGPLAPLFGAILDRGNRRINRTAIDLLDVGPEHEVLEIGFGGGAALGRLLDATGRPVAGVEISDAMVRRVSRRFRRETADGRLRVQQAGVSALPYPDSSFDRVLTVQTIHFWPDLEEGMREILRVLRPGGRLVVAKATSEEMQKRSFTRYGFRFISDEELRGLLESAGFSRVSVERRGPSVFAVGVRG